MHYSFRYLERKEKLQKKNNNQKLKQFQNDFFDLKCICRCVNLLYLHSIIQCGIKTH